MLKVSRSAKNIVKSLVFEPLKTLFEKKSEYDLSKGEEIVEEVEGVISEMKGEISRALKEYREEYEDIPRTRKDIPTPDEFEQKANSIINLLENSRKHAKSSHENRSRLMVIRSILLTVIIGVLAYKFLTLGIPSLKNEVIQQIFEYLGMIFDKIKSIGFLGIFASLAVIYFFAKFSFWPLFHEIEKRLGKDPLRKDKELLKTASGIGENFLLIVTVLNTSGFAKAAKIISQTITKIKQ